MEELSATQIGARLGVSERTAQRWIRSGRLKVTLQANGYYLVDPADIDALKPPTLPTSSVSALADILNRLERLEQQVDPLSETVKRLEAKFESQPSQIPTTAKQPLSALQEPQERASPLPEGAILLFQFARNHGVNESSVKNQARSKRFAYSERVKPNRPSEHDKYLTVEQQRGVIAFWKRNGTPFVECPMCPH